MTPEIIQAIGEYIVTPIVLGIAGVLALWVLYELFSEQND